MERGKLARGASRDAEYAPVCDLLTGTVASVLQAVSGVVLWSCVAPPQQPPPPPPPPSPSQELASAGGGGGVIVAQQQQQQSAAGGHATPRYAPPTRLHWMFDDVRLAFLGHAAARVNPLRWASGTLAEVEAQLSECLVSSGRDDAHRGVEMRYEGPGGVGEHAFANVAAAVGWTRTQMRLGGQLGGASRTHS